jgi:hypothetical protein
MQRSISTQMFSTKLASKRSLRMCRTTSGGNCVPIGGASLDLLKSSGFLAAAVIHAVKAADSSARTLANVASSRSGLRRMNCNSFDCSGCATSINPAARKAAKVEASSSSTYCPNSTPAK